MPAVKSLTLVSMCLPERRQSLLSVPLGPLYVARALADAGVEVDFRDYQLSPSANPLEPESIVSFACSGAQEVIAFSCWDNLLPHCVLAAKRIKERDPNRKIIFGGPGPTGAARRLQSHFPFIDVVVRGEGEATAVELAETGFGHLAEVPGVSFACNGTVVHNPDRGLIRHLDGIRIPAYEMAQAQQYERFHVISSRGCPFHCKFCGIPGFWNGKVRYRDICSVVSEMQLLASRYGARLVHLSDDTFLASKERFRRFCELVAPTGIPWTMYARIDELDPWSAEAAAKAGCVGVFTGVDSGSDNILKAIGKRYTSSEAYEAIKGCCTHLHVTCSFIWGFPQETVSDFIETVMMMLYLKDLDPRIETQLYFLSPFATAPITAESSRALSAEPWPGVNFSQLGRPVDHELEALVREHRDVFPAFYYFEHRDLQAKLRLATEFGLSCVQPDEVGSAPCAGRPAGLAGG